MCIQYYDERHTACIGQGYVTVVMSKLLHQSKLGRHQRSIPMRGCDHVVFDDTVTICAAVNSNSIIIMIYFLLVSPIPTEQCTGIVRCSREQSTFLYVE